MAVKKHAALPKSCWVSLVRTFRRRKGYAAAQGKESLVG